MEVKRVLVLKAAAILNHKPTSLLTLESLIENDQERVDFDMFFTDFNGLLLELIEYTKPFINENISKFLLDFKTKPIDRIINLYQFYIDEFVNESPCVFTSSHINLIAYSGNDEVKSAANKVIEPFKNALINCINDARRQNSINITESNILVDYLLMTWEGALYQQRNSGSSKPLFLYMNLLRFLLGA